MKNTALFYVDSPGIFLVYVVLATLILFLCELTLIKKNIKKNGFLISSVLHFCFFLAFYFERIYLYNLIIIVGIIYFLKKFKMTTEFLSFCFVLLAPYIFLFLFVVLSSTYKL